MNAPAPPRLRIDVLTIFPDYLAPLDLSLIGRARRDGVIDLRVRDLRDFTHDRHRTVDDTPYGGGAGMVMKPEPWAEAFDAVLTDAPAGSEPPGRSRPRLIVPGPGGTPFTQAAARRLATEDWLVFACGRYEGIDERVYDHAHEAFDGRVEIVSLGDYVLNGGEVAVLAMTEAIARLVPGVVGNAESLVEESHEDGLLEYPVYTKPATWRGRQVPPVLLQGNHGAIAAWRHEERLRRTLERRPDLLPPTALTTGSQDLPVRLAVPADAAELWTLTRACWLTEAQLNGDLFIPPLRETLESTRTSLEPESGLRTWVVRDPATGRLVGSVRGGVVQEGGRTLWEVGRLMVAPDLTGRSLGRALLDVVLAAAPRDADAARLLVGPKSERNQRMYRRAGFRPVAGGPSDHEAVVMEKRLRR